MTSIKDFPELEKKLTAWLMGWMATLGLATAVYLRFKTNVGFILVIPFGIILMVWYLVKVRIRNKNIQYPMGRSF